MNREQGVVMRFDPQVGWGFILDKDSRTIFVHFNDVENHSYLNKGEKVEYSVGADTRGRPKAVNVVRQH